jgi:hypothetical protein
VFFSIYFISFTIHENWLENQEVILPFSLKKVYLFHLAFSMLICVNFKLLSIVDKIFEQLGFIYLGTLLLKIILFCVIFYKSIITEETLSKIARLSLFIPMIIFLLTEAIFVAKILQKKQ